MQSAAAKRPEDPIELHAEVLRLQDCLAESERQRAEHEHAIEEHERQIQQLLDYITLLKRKRFGPSADRISPDQLKLFDEAELEALIAELEIAV
jgi:transposase